MRLVLLVGLLIVAGAGSACRPPEPPPPEPPEVTVATPVQREVVLYRDFTGTTDAIETVEIMARVVGFLQSQHFADGSDVEKGDLLFVIEPDEFEARLAQRKAELEAAVADLKFAESELVRSNELMRRGAITQAELEIKTADRDKAKARLELAKAALHEAELDLSYTQVHAPISGRIGRALPDVGSLVGPPDKALLTTIAKFDPIYAYFHVSEVELLEVLRDEQAQRANTTAASENGEPSAPSKDTASADDSAPANSPDDDSDDDSDATPTAAQASDAEKRRHTDPRSPERERTKALLGTPDTDEYQFEGYIDFVDNRVNPETGTIEVRAVFPNPQKILVPGMFVRIRVPYQARQNALLVEEKALGTDLGGKYLLIVGDDNIVEHRSVKIGPKIGSLRVIDEGLQPGERYVVVGILRARPGLPVRPTLREPETHDNADQQPAASGQSEPAAKAQSATMPAQSPAGVVVVSGSSVPPPSNRPLVP